MRRLLAIIIAAFAICSLQPLPLFGSAKLIDREVNESELIPLLRLAIEIGVSEKTGVGQKLCKYARARFPLCVASGCLGQLRRLISVMEPIFSPYKWRKERRQEYILTSAEHGSHLDGIADATKVRQKRASGGQPSARSGFRARMSPLSLFCRYD